MSRTSALSGTGAASIRRRRLPRLSAVEQYIQNGLAAFQFRKGSSPIWGLPDVGGVSLVLLCFLAEEEGQPSRSLRNGVARWRSSQDGSDEQMFGAEQQIHWGQSD